MFRMSWYKGGVWWLMVTAEMIAWITSLLPGGPDAQTYQIINIQIAWLAARVFTIHII